ncbi:Ribonuclease H domain [Sesbania bispinosa]|nr:Ribonuclease H domain [Sesbania bispinosa]
MKSMDMPRLVRWIPPSVSSIKINVDGSCNGSNGLCGAGGLLCDCEGHWITGFSANVGKIGVIATELYAIRRGLMICAELGYSSVWCESDSKEAIRLCLLPSIPQHHHFAVIIADIHHLLRQSWNCHLSHVLREGNSCADLLAKSCVNQVDILKLWQTPPAFMSSALLVDALVVTFLT